MTEDVVDACHNVRFAVQPILALERFPVLILPLTIMSESDNLSSC